jgi:hypothetical protein
MAVAALAGDGASSHEVRYVASYGTHDNPCTRAAPCRTLQRAINRTPAGGELIILDSGDYGNGATIDEPITISANGITATIGGSIAIDVPAGSVVLRGLTLNGVGTGANGIEIATGASVQVSVEECTIQGFGYGLRVNTEAYPMLVVADTVIRNNSQGGLYFQTGTPGLLVVENSRFENNGADGIEVRAGEASITRSVVSGNGGDGVRVTFGGETNLTWTTVENNGGSGLRMSGGQMTLERAVSRGNGEGLTVTNSGTGRVSNSLIEHNGVDMSVESGSLLTRGNNNMGIDAPLTPLEGL